MNVQLITSKTRLRLLLKFFISQANTGYLNGLANEMGESTNSIRKELETDIDNSGFTAEPTDTSSSVTTQTGKSAKSGKVTTDDSQEKTVTYKKDTSVEKESYCDNH